LRRAEIEQNVMTITFFAIGRPHTGGDGSRTGRRQTPLETTMWSPFDRMEEVAFKPVAGGYVYRAPNPWLVGAARYYLVTAEQKAELASLHRRMMRNMFWLLMLIVVVAVPLMGAFWHDHSWKALAASAAAGLVLGVLLNLWLVHKVQPIIAGLPQSNERITRGDAFKTQVATFSPGFVIGFGLLSFALLMLFILYAVLGPQGFDFNAMVGVLIFGPGTLYWAALYVMKRRRLAR
jgi:hypothetical protein